MKGHSPTDRTSVQPDCRKAQYVCSQSATNNILMKARRLIGLRPAGSINRQYLGQIGQDSRKVTQGSHMAHEAFGVLHLAFPFPYFAGYSWPQGTTIVFLGI